MNERDIKLRLGTRNQTDADGNVLKPAIPQLALDGTPAHHSMNRKGLGTYHFVVLPYTGYRFTEDDLKPFRDYIKSQDKPKTKPLSMGDSKLDKKDSK